MQTHSGPVVASRDTLTVIECAACGFAHLDPLPTAAELDAYYSGTFWERDKSQWLARYEAQRDWIDATNGDYLSVLAGHTDCHSLLDVGCGYGFLVNTAIDMGWYALGMDQSRSAIEYAWGQPNKLQFICASWEHGNYEGREFCAIVAMWLMEHLPAPLDFLRWARAHLRENGALLLAVPNEWNYFQQWSNVEGKCLPNFWVHPTHLNYWNPATFNNMLGRAGFRVVDALASWPIEFDLIQGLDYTRDEALGDKVHAHIREQELQLNRGERLVRGRMLARQSLGRDQIVIAKVDQ